MRYKRLYLNGGCYFFTVNLADRRCDLLVRHVDVLWQSVELVRQRHPFQIEAMVVLPDHLHAIWTMPENDSDFSTRWMLIKTNFSRKLPKEEHINKSRYQKGERGIWQRRFWEHLIRNEEDFQNHMNYIINNPIKHSYAKNQNEWPHIFI